MRFNKLSQVQIQHEKQVIIENEQIEFVETT